MLDLSARIVGSGPIAIPSGTGPGKQEPAPAEVRFGLDVLDDNGKAIPDRPVLQAGKAYTVKVSAGLYGTYGPFPVRSDLDLVLDFRPGPGVLIAKPIYQASHAELLGEFVHDFPITVGEEGFNREGTLEVSFKVAGSPRNPTPMFGKKVLLQESPRHAAQSALQEFAIRLETRELEDAVVLLVHEGQAGQLRLKGIHRRRILCQLDGVDNPNVGLARLWKDRIGPDIPWEKADARFLQRVVQALPGIRGAVDEFSRRRGKALVGWLKELIDAPGRPGDNPEPVTVLIIDQSGCEIPWEMTDLNPEGPSRQYLGSAARVARWVPGVILDVPGAEDPGPVLAYLGGVKEVAAAHGALNAFAAQRSPTLRQMLRELWRRPPAPVGLVYFYCHGVFASEREELTMSLRSLLENNDQISFQEFETVAWAAGPRPLVFVNGCHSARLANGFRGLPAVLLARLARAYIGTLGPVWWEDAARVAQWVFNQAGGDAHGTQPVEALRALRAEALRQLEADHADGNWQWFFAAFTYAYYGSPLARIRLKRAAPVGEGS
jgi:hypothetical protein